MHNPKTQARLARIPAIVYPEELPIAAKREEIARAIAAHQVVVIAGETGSGKTTQIPKICLDLKRGTHGFIGCTQPRRIAARTVAGRIAHELQSVPGDLVGYKVRANCIVHTQHFGQISVCSAVPLLNGSKACVEVFRFATFQLF